MADLEKTLDVIFGEKSPEVKKFESVQIYADRGNDWAILKLNRKQRDEENELRKNQLELSRIELAKAKESSVNYGLYVGNGKTWSLNECCYLLAGLQPFRSHIDTTDKYTEGQLKKVHEISFFMDGVINKKYTFPEITPPPEPNRNGKYDPLAIIKWALTTGLIDVPKPLADWCKARLEIPLDDKPLPTETTSQESPINQQSLAESEITQLAEAMEKEFNSSTPSLEDVAKRYLSNTKEVAYRKFNEGKLPFPAFRATESQKSPLLVNVKDLAHYLKNRQVLR